MAEERAVLATTGTDQRPHLVPVTFAVVGDTVVVAVDHKPKRSTDLRRLRNIRQNASVAFLVDGWSSDWSTPVPRRPISRRCRSATRSTGTSRRSAR